jgi:hypothetical protein
MKQLKALALIAICLAVPALTSAQDSTSTTSSASADSTANKSTQGKKTRTRARGARRSARAAATNNSASSETAMVTSKGPGCERGCPTSAGVAGLTGVQFLALQQEMRDRGCGNNHVTGVLDAATKAAIKSCAKKMNVEATAPAVLTAMNIGFTVGG